jgi:hypothetical protein
MNSIFKRVFAPLLCCALLTLCFASTLSLAETGLPASAAATDAPFYLTGSAIVYVTPTGKCYHSVDNCRGTKTAFPIALEEACRLGYVACKNCDPPLGIAADASAFPEGSTIVYFTIGDKCYHRTPDCGNCETAVPVTLEEALYLGRGPCKRCDPPQE